MKIWTTSTVGTSISTNCCIRTTATKSSTCRRRFCVSNKDIQAKSTLTSAPASSTPQRRREIATGTHRKYRCFSSTSEHHGRLATDKRMTPTIRTKSTDTSNVSRKCATPMHGCAKWKFPPLSMGLLVKTPFKLLTFNPGPKCHSINVKFTFDITFSFT